MSDRQAYAEMLVLIDALRRKAEKLHKASPVILSHLQQLHTGISVRLDSAPNHEEKPDGTLQNV